MIRYLLGELLSKHGLVQNFEDGLVKFPNRLTSIDPVSRLTSVGGTEPTRFSSARRIL